MGWYSPVYGPSVASKVVEESEDIVLGRCYKIDARHGGAGLSLLQ